MQIAYISVISIMNVDILYREIPVGKTHREIHVSNNGIRFLQLISPIDFPPGLVLSSGYSSKLPHNFGGVNDGYHLTNLHMDTLTTVSGVTQFTTQKFSYPVSKEKFDWEWGSEADGSIQKTTLPDVVVSETPWPIQHPFAEKKSGDKGSSSAKSDSESDDEPAPNTTHKKYQLTQTHLGYERLELFQIERLPGRAPLSDYRMAGGKGAQTINHFNPPSNDLGTLVRGIYEFVSGPAEDMYYTQGLQADIEELDRVMKEQERKRKNSASE
jgi:hypothetical protein